MVVAICAASLSPNPAKGYSNTNTPERPWGL